MTAENPIPSLFLNYALGKVPRNLEQILHVGCGKGDLGGACKQLNPHCRMTGIEISKNLADQAASHLDFVFNSDFHDSDFNSSSKSLGSFDCLIDSIPIRCISEFNERTQRYADLLNDQAVAIVYVKNPQYWKLLQSDPDLFESLNTNNLILSQFKRSLQNNGLRAFDIKLTRRQDDETTDYFDSVKPMLESKGINPNSFKHSVMSEYVFLSIRKSQQPSESIFIKNVLMQTAAKGCRKVRVEEPAAFMNTIPGVTVDVCERSHQTNNLDAKADKKIYVMQRPRIFTHPQIGIFINELVKKNFLIVVDFDDYPVSSKHAILKEINDTNGLMFRACHCVQVSTEMVADFVRQFNPNVKVFGNHIAALPPLTQKPDEQLRFFFGAVNRQQDWLPYMSVINNIIKDYPNKLAFEVICDQAFYDALETDAKQFTRTCDYPEYKQKLYGSHISFMPLEDNQFNHAKTDLKFIESAAHGAVALASNVLYEHSVEDKETGLLFNTPEDFENKLVQLIKEPGLLDAISQKAHQYVKENRMLSLHYMDKYHWYLEQADQQQSLTRAMAGRVSEFSLLY